MDAQISEIRNTIKLLEDVHKSYGNPIIITLITPDGKYYKASVKTLVQLLGQDQANAMRKSMKEAIELNNILGKQTAKISEVTKAGNKAVVTFRKWGDGARILNVQVKELTKTDEKRIVSTKKTIAKINELTAAEKKGWRQKKTGAL